MKVSALAYPCLAHGRLPKDAFAVFLEEFGVDLAR